MLVSIIIPIYNVENYIEECLESVYQQTYPQIEVILVNDCTPDNSMEIANTIINKYKDKYPTTIINHKHNKGLSEARNSGMKIAKGEYIYFIDSDDAIMPNVITLLAKVALNHKNLEMIRGSYNSGNTFIPTHRIEIKEEILFKDDRAKREFISIPYIWNILCKRSFLINYHITFNSNIRFAEDQFFGYSIAKNLSFMAKVPHAIYFYRQRENSLCHNITPKHFVNLLKLLSFINNNLFSNKTIREIQINRFCCTSFNYWSKSWKQCDSHRYYYNNFKSNIKAFISRNYKYMKISNYLLIFPFYLPYKPAIYISKIVWKIRNILNI